MSVAIETVRERSIEAGRRVWDFAENVRGRIRSLNTAFARGSEKLIIKIPPLYRWLNETKTSTTRCRVEELPIANSYLIAELGTRPAQGMESRPNSYVAYITMIRIRDGFTAPWRDEVIISDPSNGMVRQQRWTDGSLISFKKS